MKILEYIKNTTPATAYTNNSESGRKMIFEELKKEVISIKSAKESFEMLGMKEESSKLSKDFNFAVTWLAKFFKITTAHTI